MHALSLSGVEKNVLKETWLILHLSHGSASFFVYTEQQPENLDQTWYDAMKAGRGHNKPREIPVRALSFSNNLKTRVTRILNGAGSIFRMKPERRNAFDAEQQISISSSTDGFSSKGTSGAHVNDGMAERKIGRRLWLRRKQKASQL